MGCGTSRGVSTHPKGGPRESLEKRPKIRPNKNSSRTNLLDGSPVLKLTSENVDQDDELFLPGAVLHSLPPLRRPNGTLLHNGFNDDLALTATSLMKRNVPLHDIRERPKSADILQELLVQGIIPNQTPPEGLREAHNSLMMSADKFLKKFPVRLDKLRKETLKQKNVTIEDIENNMISAEERKKLNEIKITERQNTFKTPVQDIQDSNAELLCADDNAVLEEIVDEILTAQHKLLQEEQEASVQKEEINNQVINATQNQQKNEDKPQDNCDLVDLDSEVNYNLPLKTAEVL